MSKSKLYFVTMVDTFFSGWHKAKNGKARYIYICESWQEALKVAEYAESRGDQKYVNACISRPSFYRSTWGDAYYIGNDYVQIKTKENNPNWYNQ